MTVTIHDDRPKYGLGKFGRPLWSGRDRDAEQIRKCLRRAGFHDMSERYLDGFAVEGADPTDDRAEPFSVAYCGDATLGNAPAEVVLGRYREVLEQAGFRVEPDPDDSWDCLLVSVPKLAGSAARNGLLTVAVILAMIAAGGLLVSWFGSDVVKLFGGTIAAVTGVLAVLAAGAWYRSDRV